MKKERIKLHVKKWTVAILRAVFLLAFAYILIYPVLFMISNALKTSADNMNPAVTWLSRAPTLYSFRAAFTIMDYPRALLNTVKFELISAVIEVFVCAVYAYGLARFKLRFKRVMMFFLVLIILVPDVMLIIPRIVNFRHMDFLGILGLLKELTGFDLRPNLTDSVLTFYLPSLFGVGLKGGLFIYIYMQFFKGLPAELEEAAWLDGAGPFTTFMRVILPSSGVVILTVFIFSFVWHWNDWLLAIMYTDQNDTLAVITKNINQYISYASESAVIQLDSKRSFGIPLAACLLYIAPPTVLYLILQKKFIQSIDRVGIVG